MGSKHIALPMLAQILKCPVCLQYSSGEQYFQCCNGHFVCSECFSRLRDCPVCRLYMVPFRCQIIKTVSVEVLTALTSEIRHVENYNGHISVRRVLDLFKCSECHRNPTRRPILQCEKAHLLCYECSLEATSCPDCDKVSCAPIMRSLFAENVLSLVDKHCRFHNHGCKATILDLNDHEKEDCLFKDVPCPSIECKAIVSMSNLLDHLKNSNEKHYNLQLELLQETNTNESSGFIDLPGTFGDNIFLITPFEKWSKVTHMTLDGKTNFFFACFACKCSQLFVSWVSYLGRPKDSEHFAFKLRLFREGSKKEIEISGPVIPVGIPYINMLTYPKAYKIHFKEVKDYWNQNGLSLSWEVTILRKLPQVKETIQTKLINREGSTDLQYSGET